MKQISVVIIGAGGRGMTYARNMAKAPDHYRFVAVADPNPYRIALAKETCNLTEEQCYPDWQTLLSYPKMADLAVIATQDNNHYEAALKAIDLGYNLLLEKPVAQTAQQCVDIANAARAKGVSVLVCHVLRYTPFFKRIKSIIDAGTIGDIVSVEHVEAVGNLHQSHSYVRGAWRDEAESTPMLLAKCCHDLDIIQWMIGKPCKKVSSFGELTHFTPENAPEGAPTRCMDGNCPVAETCPYNCETVYSNTKDWFRNKIANHLTKGSPTPEEQAEALRTTNYGMCVYHAGNDVVDHQVVSMQFAGGITATLTMNAFNRGGRFTRLFGTKGELLAYASDTEIEVYTFADRKTTMIPVLKTEESIAGGHGGGDAGIVADLYEYLCGTYTGCSVADISVSVANHLIGFAAEEARHNDTVVALDSFFARNNYENKYF